MFRPPPGGPIAHTNITSTIFRKNPTLFKSYHPEIESELKQQLHSLRAEAVEPFYAGRPH